MAARKSGRAKSSPPSPHKQGSSAAKPPAAGSFAFVATPIGHAGDITLRALEALKAADRIYCEDTRVTAKLLTLYGIAGKKLSSAHAHSERAGAEHIYRDIQDGLNVIYVSDAGLPAISDPGYLITQHLLQHGVKITSLPGANAALTALQISGLPTDNFYFAGFLPQKTKARKDALESLRTLPATLVFYESPHRLLDSLADMKTVLGDRPIAAARELTKMFEEVRRGAISDVIRIFAEKDAIKGEFVLVVGAFTGDAKDAAEAEADQAEIDRLLLEARRTLSARDAAAIMSTKTGIPKRELYQRLLHLNDKKK